MALAQKRNPGCIITYGKEKTFFKKVNDGQGRLMDNQELNFIELNQSKVTDEVIQQFDCGNEDMTEYLHKYAKNDSIEGKGVTYVLVAEDRKRIYAYATIKAYS